MENKEDMMRNLPKPKCIRAYLIRKFKNQTYNIVPLLYLQDYPFDLESSACLSSTEEGRESSPQLIIDLQHICAYNVLKHTHTHTAHTFTQS